jgi:hypothetical protein
MMEARIKDMMADACKTNFENLAENGLKKNWRVWWLLLRDQWAMLGYRRDG